MFEALGYTVAVRQDSLYRQDDYGEHVFVWLMPWPHGCQFDIWGLEIE